MLQGFGKVSIRKKDMNETQFKSEKYCKKSDVVSIPINQIHKPTIRGGQQVRQGAEDSGHIRAIAASMKESGQSVPISVEKEINGTYTLVAGSHRFGAALKNKQSHIDAVVLSFRTSKERFLFQIEENEETPKMNNDANTREYILGELINVHKHFHVNGKPPTLEYVYEEVRNQKIFNGLHTASLLPMLKRIFKNKPTNQQSVYEKYDKESTGLKRVKELYVDDKGNPFWDGDDIREIDNGISIFMVGTSQNASSAVENALFAKLKNPNIKTVAFCWVDNVFKKTDDGFDKYRKAEYKRIASANNAYFLKPGFKFIDEVWFFPQKPSENLGKLYKPEEVIGALNPRLKSAA